MIKTIKVNNHLYSGIKKVDFGYEFDSSCGNVEIFIVLDDEYRHVLWKPEDLVKIGAFTGAKKELEERIVNECKCVVSELGKYLGKLLEDGVSEINLDDIVKVVIGNLEGRMIEIVKGLYGLEYLICCALWECSVQVYKICNIVMRLLYIKWKDVNEFLKDECGISEVDSYDVVFLVFEWDTWKIPYLMEYGDVLTKKRDIVFVGMSLDKCLEILNSLSIDTEIVEKFLDMKQ